jgi:trimeric autotransporter adhesin
VTGNGAAGSGGTIQNITTRGASFVQSQKISLAHMRFLNANMIDGAVADGGVAGTANKDEHGAIYLQDVVEADLAELLIDGTAQHGINGNNVTDLDITNTTIRNVGDAIWEASINLVDLNRVASAGQVNVFSGLHVTNDSGANNIAVVNTFPGEWGERDRLVITDSFFSRVGNNPVVSDNISIGSRLGASLWVVVSNSTFSSTHSCGAPTFADACVEDAIHADVRDFALFDLEVATGNDFTGAAAGASAINLTASGGLGLFDVRNITTTVGSLAAINAAVTATDPSAALRGRIVNNRLSTSAPLAAAGIQMVINGAGTMAVEVADNIVEGDVSNRFHYGILGGAQAGSGRTEFMVSNNQVEGANIAGASFFAGNGTGGETNRTCVNFANNRIDGFDVPSTALADYLLRMFTGTMFHIEGLAGSGTDASNVAGFVAATDTDPSPTNPIVDVSTGTLVNYTVAAACTAP